MIFLDETTSIRLKKALSLRNMKQTDLVEKTGIGKSAISQYLSGKIVPKQDKIYLIAQALDVNESWLMGYNVEMDRGMTTENSSISLSEKAILKKYRLLDDKGQHTVSTVLDMEYNRCTNNHLVPVAAHNDNITDNELELINKDLEDMNSW